MQNTTMLFYGMVHGNALAIFVSGFYLAERGVRASYARHFLRTCCALLCLARVRRRALEPSILMLPSANVAEELPTPS